MANDRENKDQSQRETGSTENIGRERQERFNELSELSLEERMNAADRIGIPVETVSNAADGSGDRMEEESMGDETDR
jgi:hypothetical protein